MYIYIYMEREREREREKERKRERERWDGYLDRRGGLEGHPFEVVEQQRVCQPQFRKRPAFVQSLRSVHTNQPHSGERAAIFAGGWPD